MPANPTQHEATTGPASPAARPLLPARARRWAVALVVLLVVVWGITATMMVAAKTGPDGESPAAGQSTPRLAADLPQPSTPGAEIVEGPFGRLEIVPFFIAPPEELLWQLHELSAEQLSEEDTDWRFPNTTPADLAALLARLQLPEALRSKLRSLAEPDPSIRGLSIRPPKQLVLGLAPEHRAAIYCALQEYPQNSVLRSGFRCAADSVGQWLDNAPLQPATRELVDPLVYRWGTMLFFSDLTTVGPMLASDAEYLALLKALSRERTFLLNLKLSPDSDVDALVRYWGRGGRESQVRPLLQSLAESPGEIRLDITQLLPTFARERLYTYPTPEMVVGASQHDCHWTALNFFNDQPVERYGLEGQNVEALQKDYRRIDGQPQFGDLILYVGRTPAGETVTIHSAIYLAAEIVFTKNGSTYGHPWMLMKRDAMYDYYPQPTGLKEVVFRLKGF